MSDQTGFDEPIDESSQQVTIPLLEYRNLQLLHANVKLVLDVLEDIILSHPVETDHRMVWAYNEGVKTSFRHINRVLKRHVTNDEKTDANG